MTLSWSNFFRWPALWHQPSSILKRLLAETDFLASPPCGANPTPSSKASWPKPIFFASPPCSANPTPSSNDPWPKPIFCWPAVLRRTTSKPIFFWPALWHELSSILKRLLAETDFLAGPRCGANPTPSSNDPWPKPIFCWPPFWRRVTSIRKRPLAETDFFGLPSGFGQLPSSNDRLKVGLRQDQTVAPAKASQQDFRH